MRCAIYRFLKKKFDFFIEEVLQATQLVSACFLVYLKVKSNIHLECLINIISLKNYRIINHNLVSRLEMWFK